MMWRHPPTSSRLRLAWRLALLAGPAVLVTVAGFLAVRQAPPSVNTETPVALVWAWAATLVAGGGLVLAGIFGRRLRPQLAGQALASGATAFYAIHLLDTPTGHIAAALLAASSLGSLGEAYRHVDLARWARHDRDRSRRAHPAARRRG